KGDAIPPLVRILSVCDIYDSLSSDRPYRKAIPHETCLEILRDNALHGGLDPELVALFALVIQPAPRVEAGRSPGEAGDGIAAHLPSSRPSRCGWALTWTRSSLAPGPTVW